MEFLQLTVGGLRIGAIYGVVGLGLIVVYKSTRIVNFAHGALVMVGSYAGALLSNAAGTSFLVTAAVAGLFTAAFAALSERTILRPLRHVDAFAGVIATVALAVILMAIARVYYGSTILSVPGPGSSDPIRIGQIVVTTDGLLITMLSVGVGVSTLLFFKLTRLGTVFRAVADNPIGAELCGYRLDRLSNGSWALGGFLAGMAGVLIAPITGVTPDLMLLIVPAFIVAVVGGFDSPAGVILAGLLIGLIETYVARYISTGSKEAVGLLLMLAVLYFRPQGLFAEVEVTKV